MNYKSEVKLGKRYRDTDTGFEGVAGSVTFYQHGCERVVLKGTNLQGELKEYSFDVPEVELVETGERLKVLEEKTGGPHDRAPMRRR